MSKDNGTGWRYQCWNCNHQVGVDKLLPKTCPGCGAGGWWGHLTPTGVIDKPGQEISIKNSNETMPEGIKRQAGILSQLPDAVVCSGEKIEGIFEHPPARGRGRPRQAVPDDLILELSGQGFSSRAMVGELSKRGLKVSYKTVQRRLQGALL